MNSNSFCQSIGEYDTKGFRRKVVAVIPAAGLGLRMTPMWARMNIFQDTVAKPALSDLLYRRPLLDVIFDTLLEGGVVEKILLRTGFKPKKREECVSTGDKIIFKMYKDLKSIADKRVDAVDIFFNNPDGGDDGTGATIVSREAKRLLAREHNVEHVLICYGDTPTVSAEKFKKIITFHVKTGNDITLISSVVENPFGFGRIIRCPKMVLRVSEMNKTQQLQEDKFRDLNQKIRDGELLLVRIHEVDKERYGEWAQYLCITKAEYKRLKGNERLTLYHPKCECLPGGCIKLTKKDISKRLVKLQEQQIVIWHSQTDSFLEIKEQSEFGKTEQERKNIGSLRIIGLDYKLSTDYMHAIKERNNGLLLMKKEVFLNTIRDLDAPNYARVVRDEKGKEIALIPNGKIKRMKKGEVLSIKGKNFSKEEIESIIECRKVGETKERIYVLERHAKNEYYLPETANRVKANAGRVGVLRLPENTVRSYDSRTDIRKDAVFQNDKLIEELRQSKVRVRKDTRFRIGNGFDVTNIEPSSTLNGNIVLMGDLKIRSGTILKDVEIWNYTIHTLIIGGEKCEITKSMIVDCNVDANAIIKSSEIVGVDISQNEMVENQVIRLGKNNKVLRMTNRSLSSVWEYGIRSQDYLDLTRLEEEQIDVLEQVYAVSVEPWAEIYVDPGIKSFLQTLASVIGKLGSSKIFCECYEEEMRNGSFSDIPGLERFGDFRFYIGAHTMLSGKVGLRGNIYIEPWVEIFNSVIRDSQIKRNAMIWNSLVGQSIVDSGPKMVTLINGERILRQEIKAGYPKSQSKDSVGQKISKWIRVLGRPTDEILQKLNQIYGDEPEVIQERLQTFLTIVEEFGRIYGHNENIFIAHSPARVNLMGVHIEHQGGDCNYVTVNKEIIVVVSKRYDDKVVMNNIDSRRFETRSFYIGEELNVKERGDWLNYIDKIEIIPGDWSNYIRAAVLSLQDRCVDIELKGMNILVSGNIPISGGLSSSSALVIATALATMKVNNLNIPSEELTELCGKGEWFVGTRGGAGDHAAMLFGKRGFVSHVKFFPFKIESVALPKGYKIVVCNSFKEAMKGAKTKSLFNEKVATYEMGTMLIQELFPQFSDRILRLTDLNTKNIGVDDVSIYRILKSLPELISREELLKRLPHQREKLYNIFKTHSNPKEGYKVRQVCLFGLAENQRARIFADLLTNENMEEIGKMMSVSHDGDRIVRFDQIWNKTKWDNRVTDEYLDRLMEDLQSCDPTRVKRALLCYQPGGYGCSIEELDRLVDITSNVDGVIGAGLTGAGLGGCVVVIIRKENVKELRQAVRENYYIPEKLPFGDEVCVPIGGAGILDL